MTSTGSGFSRSDSVVADPRTQVAEPSETTQAGPVTEACSFASESHVYAADTESPRTEGS